MASSQQGELMQGHHELIRLLQEMRNGGLTRIRGTTVYLAFTILHCIMSSLSRCTSPNHALLLANLGHEYAPARQYCEQKQPSYWTRAMSHKIVSARRLLVDACLFHKDAM
jgi:hypothetical protein